MLCDSGGATCPCPLDYYCKMAPVVPGEAYGGGHCERISDRPEYDLCDQRRAREQVSPLLPAKVRKLIEYTSGILQGRRWVAGLEEVALVLLDTTARCL
jgi:hypothetical protein